MPTAGPPTAATTGFFMRGSASNSARAGEAPGVRGALMKSATSLPAVKQSALPCSSTARAWGSASAAASAAPSIAYISAVIAFFLSARSNQIRATRSPPFFPRSLLIKAVVLELLPQRKLRELAGRGVRQLVHEDHVIGHPPLGDLALVEPQELLLGHLLARLLDRDDDRTLVPFRVTHADHRGFGDRRVRDRDVLEVDRADPLAARLDHVLRAVGDLHVAVGVDRGDVAGGEPAVLQRIAALALEVAARDPRPAHHQVAEALAVPGQFLAFLVHDLHLDAEQAPALLRLHRELAAAVERRLARFQRAHGAKRAHLGHAPGMEHLYAVVVLEGADHRRRAGRAA